MTSALNCITVSSLFLWLHSIPLDRSSGKFHFSVSLRKSEAKTFINHHEDPLWLHCLWASPVLNCLLGMAIQNNPNWPFAIGSDPPWHQVLKGWLPPASPPTPAPQFSSDVGILLPWWRFSPLWQNFTTQTFLFSTNFHNAGWKWCSLIRKPDLQWGERYWFWHGACSMHIGKICCSQFKTLLEWLCAWFSLSVVNWSIYTPFSKINKNKFLPRHNVEYN